MFVVIEHQPPWRNRESTTEQIMKVYAQATDKTTSTGKIVYQVWDQFDARQAGQECNFEVAQIEDLAAGDDTAHTVLDDYKDFIIINSDGLVDIDREAVQAAFPAGEEDFSGTDIQGAIRQHGARAVYQAASRHMSDGKSLMAVGLIAQTLADVWAAQSAAYAAMGEADKAIDHADVQARLDEIGND